MKRTKSILKHDPDIRPLDQRMSQDKAKELRKGMQRTQETVNIKFLENQRTLNFIDDMLIQEQEEEQEAWEREMYG
jgi:hypothetical protein